MSEAILDCIPPMETGVESPNVPTPLAVVDRQDDGLESSVSPLSQALPKRITYGARYRKGLPLSSAIVECAVNGGGDPAHGQETADAMVR